MHDTEYKRQVTDLEPQIFRAFTPRTLSGHKSEVEKYRGRRNLEIRVSVTVAKNEFTDVVEGR